MNEDYSQAFYVPIGRGRVNLHTGQRGGYYLPSLEPKDPPEVKPEPRYIIRGLTPKERDNFNQLKAQVLFLSDKVNQMRAKASKQRKDTI